MKLYLNVDIMGIKQAISNYFHQEIDMSKRIGGNSKAAKMVGISSVHEQHVKGEKWSDILRVYSDYFIRY
ncbi:MAG: hypothetical protein COA83_01495 [Methylophaga sp.]|nr:MAG: hypothetical protein COA83_01495 [Methylophaga sp.]